MDYINSSNAVPVAPPGKGFIDCSPGVDGTFASAEWLNGLNYELMHFITSVGVTPEAFSSSSPSSYQQLVRALGRHLLTKGLAVWTGDATKSYPWTVLGSNWDIYDLKPGGNPAVNPTSGAGANEWDRYTLGLGSSGTPGFVRFCAGDEARQGFDHQAAMTPNDLIIGMSRIVTLDAALGNADGGADGRTYATIGQMLNKTPFGSRTACFLNTDIVLDDFYTIQSQQINFLGIDRFKKLIRPDGAVVSLSLRNSFVKFQRITIDFGQTNDPNSTLEKMFILGERSHLRLGNFANDPASSFVTVNATDGSNNPLIRAGALSQVTLTGADLNGNGQALVDNGGDSWCFHQSALTVSGFSIPSNGYKNS